MPNAHVHAGAPAFGADMHSDSLRLNNGAAAALNGSADGSAHLNGLAGVSGLDGSAAQPMVLGEQPLLYANGAAPAGGANGLVPPIITTGELLKPVRACHHGTGCFRSGTSAWALLAG